MLYFVILIVVIFVLYLVFFRESTGTEVFGSSSSLVVDFENVCIFDFETTGLSVGRGDRIVEYAFIKVKSGVGEYHELEIISALVSPEGKKISKKASEINGITDEMVKDANLFRNELVQILEFVGNRKLVAHNVSFDREFFEDELRRAGYSKSFEYVDSIDLVKKKFPMLERYSLEYLCQVCKIEKPNHRAESDVVALYKLLLCVNTA